MKNVVLLGLVSLFADISTEMVYPIIPLYLVFAYGATPAIVGIIEGIAESLASLLKVFSGYISDRYKRKKPLAFIGYAATLIYKLGLIISTSWAGILGSRVVDRVGKGIRTSPRDVLVAESSSVSKLGKAFGLHKALDMLGSAIGILLAYLLIKDIGTDGNYKKVFMISIIPAIIALCVLGFVKEKKELSNAKTQKNLLQGFKGIDKQLKAFLIIAFIFTLGNSSNAFLILRAQNTGVNPSHVILLYFIYNLTASLFAFPLGKLSDRIGRKNLLVVGYVLFAIVYIGFAFVKNTITVICLFFLYGIYTALTAGVERAYIAEVAPPSFKGTMLGMHSTLVGIALLPASIIAGILWDFVSPVAPFLYGGTLALIAAISLYIIMPSPKSYSS